MFAIYDSSGVIDSIFSGEESECRLNSLTYLPCSSDISDRTHYVSSPEATPAIAEKEPIGGRHQVRGFEVTIEGLPPGTSIEVDKAVAISGGGGVDTVEFDTPGTYTIKLRPPVQYLDETLEVKIG